MLTSKSMKQYLFSCRKMFDTRYFYQESLGKQEYIVLLQHSKLITSTALYFLKRFYYDGNLDSLPQHCP